MTPFEPEVAVVADRVPQAPVTFGVSWKVTTSLPNGEPFSAVVAVMDDVAVPLAGSERGLMKMATAWVVVVTGGVCEMTAVPMLLLPVVVARTVHVP